MYYPCWPRHRAEYQSGPILRLYRDLGGEIITLGSDAHTPEYVGCAITDRQALLRACGFDYFATFDRLVPVYHKL